LQIDIEKIDDSIVASGDLSIISCPKIPCVNPATSSLIISKISSQPLRPTG
jgi:hypothetical protein